MAQSATTVGSRRGKSAGAFRTIGEVSEQLDLPQHVLRFWESKFNRIRPLKRGGGRRYYRPEDVQLLRRIRSLLYEDGYTIKGVQKLLREGGVKLDASAGGQAPAKASESPADAAAASAPGGGPQTPAPATPASPPPPAGLTPEKRLALQRLLGELQDLQRLLDDGDS